MAYKKYPTLVTPAGVAAYAWFSKTDTGHKFSDDKYKVTLVLDPKEPGVKDAIKAMTDKAKAVFKEEHGGLPKDIKLPFVDGNTKKDADGNQKEEFAGKVLMTIKSKFQPGFFDTKRKELPDGVFPMSGDLVKVSASYFPYEKGVSLQLRNVQLIDKRNSGTDGAGDFDDEEGYEVPGDTAEGTTGDDDTSDF